MSAATETHTGRYGDVTAAPASVLAAVGAFVAREWGEGYRMGYVGAHEGSSNEGTYCHVWQVKAPDGSRFAVGASRYGQPFELEGSAWLAFLQLHGIEATLRGVR